MCEEQFGVVRLLIFAKAIPDLIHIHDRLLHTIYIGGRKEGVDGREILNHAV